MNSKFLKLLCGILAFMMTLTIFASCGKKPGTNPGGNSSSPNQSSSEPAGPGGPTTNKEYDNDTDALVFSSGEFDGVFNPFFSTSAYDSTIQGQTQIGMLSADDYGNEVAFGKDQPVVTLDFNETMYTKDGNVTLEGDEKGTTVYQMVLKNGILFSDGQPLTAHDVLFNMYVYLDPAYTGSSTMYSTDIVGLRNYQIQELGEVNEGAAAAKEATFAALAGQRINIICAYVTDEDYSALMGVYNDLRADQLIEEIYNEESIREDIQNVKETWLEEIATDWNNSAADLASMQKEYPFTKTWQLYFYNEGLISRVSNTTAGVTTYPKDADGKYQIEWQGYDPNDDYTKEQAIELVKTTYLHADMSNDEFVASILGGWATSATMAAEFAAEEKGLYYDARKGEDGELTVKNIEGIKIKNGSEFTGTKKYNEDYSQYDMLEITINGVDPKAKWNFAFSVAPMHYYSTTELTAAALADTEYSSNFGVKFSDISFMNQLKRRNDVPMGAGIYQASTMHDYKYDWANDEASFKTLSEGFLSDNICYFIANENFYTTGGDINAVHNAKIKHVQYKVVNSANTMTALQGGTIHYADPSATTENINIITNHPDLQRIMVKTAGYGYIGVNAKYVPNINVRRAIMSAMDISLVQNYYPGTLSEPIYRSFSKVSWVYNAFEEYGVTAWNPESLDGNVNEQYYPYYGTKDAVKEAVKYYLEKGKCKFVNGKWYDDKGQPLKYTFTVAGDTTDHPAYKTFLNARDILNEMGLEIEVIPDSRALYKLASGSLAIWAAAWSSSLDPDMYQVYHKNSKATSVLNWGYDWIKASGTNEEKELINEISDLIEAGRKTINAAERTELYRSASDYVMDLAVELPVYQRSDMYVYNDKVLDKNTFKANPTPYAGPLSEMWKVSFVNN